MTAPIATSPRRAPDDLVWVTGLVKQFPVKSGLLSRTTKTVKAVDNVSFSIRKGEVVGLVGESGSGKTTVGRLLLRLEEPTAGTIQFDGTDISLLPAPQMRAFRQRMQVVFQDPYASLNPRERLGAVLMHAMSVHSIGAAKERRQMAIDLLSQVGLPADYFDRFPHEFSGGQRQRIGIARALAVSPEFIVADEPVSALDVSIQAQIINLLEDMKERYRLTMLFIAHDLAVVEHIADRVIVMYLGNIVEVASTRDLFRRPHHPYTQGLLSAMPVPDPEAQRHRIILKGDIPSPIDPPSGCVFRSRCPIARPSCAETKPELETVEKGHLSACPYGG